MEESSYFDVQYVLMRSVTIAIVLLFISACAPQIQDVQAPVIAELTEQPSKDDGFGYEKALQKEEHLEVNPTPIEEKEDPPLAIPHPPSDGLPIPECVAVGEDPPQYSRAQRQETRDRVQAVCKAVSASPIICAYMDLITVRESSGRAGVRHVKGHNENGLGAMGLSLRWHSDKWPGDDEDPQFCHPEVSAIVALAIMHRAMIRYNAKNVVELQSIYAGHWYCEGEGRDRKCHPRVVPRDTNVCSRLSARGHDCWEQIDQSDLGRKIPLNKRREFVADMLSKFESERGPSS